MLLFQFFYYSRTTRRALRFSLGITGDGMATHLRGDRCALFPAVIVAAARLVNIITSWFLFAAASFFLSFFPPFTTLAFSLCQGVWRYWTELSLFFFPFEVQCLFIPEDATFTIFANDAIFVFFSSVNLFIWSFVQLFTWWTLTLCYQICTSAKY